MPMSQSSKPEDIGPEQAEPEQAKSKPNKGGSPSLQSANIETLVRNARQGDTAAYGEVVRRFQDMAVGYARSRLGDTHLAEDAAQEAFIQAFDLLGQLQRAEAFPGWFRAVLHTHCERQRRSRRLHTGLEGVMQVAGGTDPALQLENKEQAVAVQNEVEALPETERLVVTLAYMANCSHRQIADFLGLDQQTVNNRLRRARSRLAARLRCPTRRHLRRQAPSQSPTFIREVKQMIKPVEFSRTRPAQLPGGHAATNNEVWQMLSACQQGDMEAVRLLAESCPGLVHCTYNYTPPIHFAVREGHLPVVRYLLEHGADPSYSSYGFKDSLLRMASERGWNEIAALIEKALSTRFPLSVAAHDLLEACAKGDTALVHRLLAEDKALVRSSDDKGETPLHQACAAGHYDIVRMLIEAGAEVGAVRADGFKPIHSALFVNGQGWIRQGNSGETLQAGRIAEYLLQHGEPYTIFLAAVFGDTEAIKRELLRDSALANFADTHQRRPLSAAAWRDDMAMVRLLLDHGADPSLPERDAPLGHAVWIAAQRQNAEMLRLLLDHGADPESNAESGGRALDHVRHQPELYSLLIEHGARQHQSPAEQVHNAISDGDRELVATLLAQYPEVISDPEMFWGEGILVLVAREANWPLLKLLIQHGAGVPPVSKWGGSYYFKHLDVGEYLLKNGMDANHLNWHRTTLLHDMAWQGLDDKAQLLLEYGADIDAVDDEYRSTPLGLAARAGRLATVQMLLAQGADPCKAGADWATPLAWARLGRHEDVVAEIESHL
jgi:RNA polymerase sigma factor (sigma-70 family)